MKRLVAFVTALLFGFSLSFSAAAYNKNSVFLEGCTAKNNRLIQIEGGMRSEHTLCAATFVIKYDPGVLEFRKAESLLGDSVVDYADKGKGEAKAIFLSGKGINVKNGKKLLRLTFKTVSSGSGSIRISAEDCVSSELENFSAPKSSQSIVSIEGSSAKIRSFGRGSGGSDEKSGGNFEKESQNTSESSENSTDFQIKSDYNFADTGSFTAAALPVIAGAVFAGVAVGACVLAYFIGRKMNK